jgi:hypothetical protein
VPQEDIRRSDRCAERALDGSGLRKLHRHLQDAERRSADSADWRADKVLDQRDVPAEYQGNNWRGFR